MEYCPYCGADVEGLVNHCDLCGAPLDCKPSLFHRTAYSMPECLGFGRLVDETLDEIEPSHSIRYSDFLKQIKISIVCYPASLLESGNIKERVIYYPKRKIALITIVVDYYDYVPADKNEKAGLVAEGINRGIKMLHERLGRYKLGIPELVAQADAVYKKHCIRDSQIMP